jgi:hypothetical protein
MTKRLAVAFVSLLAVLAGATASPRTASAAPAGTTHPAGVHALKGMPRVGAHSLTSCTVSTGCYNYVYGRQTLTGTNTILQSRALMANPYVHDGHSLQEIAAESADSNQIVEVGWTKDPAVCGASATTTCAFTFAWKNNVPLCYNGCGYLDIASNPFNVGAAFPTADMGAVKSFTIQHLGSPQSPAGWYVYYNGVAMGVWPDSIWTATPAVTFTSYNFYQVFGEVASVPGATNPDPSCDDMGTGVQGSLGQTVTPKPSSWSSTQVNGSATGVNMTVGATIPAYWSGLAGASPVTAFSLGGPGANSAGAAVGTAGSC